MRSNTFLLALPLAAATSVSRAPLIASRSTETLEDKYIVMMKNDARINAASSIQSAVDSIVADADQVYKKLGGFSATLTAEEVDSLRSNPNVSGAPTPVLSPT